MQLTHGTHPTTIGPIWHLTRCSELRWGFIHLGKKLKQVGIGRICHAANLNRLRSPTIQ